MFYTGPPNSANSRKIKKSELDIKATGIFAVKDFERGSIHLNAHVGFVTYMAVMFEFQGRDVWTNVQRGVMMWARALRPNDPVV